MSDLQLIVGLGNPGSRYAETRHNAGVWFLEQLHQSQSYPAFKKESKLCGYLSHSGGLKLLVPTTYMNESGTAVAAVAQYYKIPPHRILVAHDELDIPAGHIRCKNSGGHGGHNGIRSIIQHLGTSAFHRLRIGIGRPTTPQAVHDFVLSRPLSAERQLIDNKLTQVLEVLPKLLAQDWHYVMNTLH